MIKNLDKKIFLALILSPFLYGGYAWLRSDWKPAEKSEIIRLYKHYPEERGGFLDGFLCNVNSYRDKKIKQKQDRLYRQSTFDNNDMQYIFDAIKNDKQWWGYNASTLKRNFIDNKSDRARTGKLNDFLLRNFIDILRLDIPDINYTATRVLAKDGSEAAFNALKEAFDNCLNKKSGVMCFNYSDAISMIGGWKAIESLSTALNKYDGFIDDIIKATRTREQKAWVYRFLIDKYQDPTDEQKRRLRVYKKDIEKLKLEAGIYDALPFHIFY